MPGDSGVMHLTVRIHPADQDLVGHDVIADDQDLCRLLDAMGRRIRVTVHELVPNADVLRGHATVTVAGVTANVPGTRAVDEADKDEDGGLTRGARLIRIGSDEEVPVPAAGGVIGRDTESCQVVVDAPTVSRTHARLRPRSGGFSVEDLGSSNGLTINSRRTELGQLHNGDILGLGKVVRLRLEVSDR